MRITRNCQIQLALFHHLKYKWQEDMVSNYFSFFFQKQQYFFLLYSQ